MKTVKYKGASYFVWVFIFCQKMRHETHWRRVHGKLDNNNNNADTGKSNLIYFDKETSLILFVIFSILFCTWPSIKECLLFWDGRVEQSQESIEEELPCQNWKTNKQTNRKKQACR